MSDRPVRSSEDGGQRELVLRPGIQDRFEAYHRDNPNVYSMLVSLARYHIRRRRGVRLGIGYLFEILRWRFFLQVGTLDAFKFNNDFRSRYVRLIEEHEPDLRGVFEKRTLRSN